MGNEGAARFADRVVVVTGAAQGQGAAEVQQAAAEGATVIATDARPFSCDHAHVRQLDVADPAGWTDLAEWIGAEFGHVEGLVNNAGITSRVRLPDVQLDDWNRVLAVNVTGAMLGMKALAPLMREGSAIVNVGSVAALNGHYTAAYTTSKWALRGLSMVAATEFGPRGIRVNIVHPGFIETPMTASAPAVFRTTNLALTPLSRAGMPAEVAALVLFLLSTEASFITGAEVTADGGYTMGGAAKAISDALQEATP